MKKNSSGLKMNSGTPMKLTECSNKLILRADEVCAIIEAAGKASVRELTYGNLHLCLGPQPEIYPILPVSVNDREPDHAGQNAEALKRDEEEVRAEQLRMLMIEDPVKYEQMLRDGELTDEDPELDDI